MTDLAQRPRTGQSGRALLTTILGEFALPNGGSIWTSSVIESLALLDVGETNARQAAARLGADGIVEPCRRGRSTQWQLTDRGRLLLSDGAERIYGFGSQPTEWDRRWLLVFTSVPEDLRAKRHHLRNQLGFAGFGFLNAGTAISPHVSRTRQAEGIVAKLEIEPAALIFSSTTTQPELDAEIIARAWDLDALADMYRAFIAAFSGRRPVKGPSCFAALVKLVHEWRRFPFEDPEIPTELLPASWPGAKAKATFDARRDEWSPEAQAWFRSIEANA